MDELVKRLRKKAEAFDYDGWVETASDYEEAADAIEGLICEVADEHNARLDAEERRRWIPVSEQTPNEYTTILFITGGGELRVGYYDSDHKSYCDMTGFRYMCTHWMSAPQPPKEE